MAERALKVDGKPLDEKFAALWGLGQSAGAMVRAFVYLRSATTLGRKVRVWGRPSVQNWGVMHIGERVRLVSTIATLELVSGPQGRLEIGAGSYINYGCSIAAQELVHIGPRCNIGTYCMIVDNNFHRLEPERRHEMPPSQPVILEENVWLGGRVIVLPGVTIGADSVVGAGSVVTHDVPAGVVVAGQPARVLRHL